MPSVGVVVTEAISEDQVKRHKGLFCWDEKLLKENIKLTKPDYDEWDPKTWPLFDEDHILRATGSVYTGDGPTLPVGVAYDVTVMEKYLSKHPEAEVESSPSQRYPCLFRDYPLNFFKCGSRRLIIRMLATEYENWRQEYVPADKQLLLGGTQNDNEGSNNAYHKVMEMLRDKEAGSSAALAKIKIELADTQEKLRQETAQGVRASIAFSDTLADLRTDLTAMTDRATELRERNDDLTVKLEESNERVLAAQREAREAKQQVVNIWSKLEEIHKGEDTSTPGSEKKRKFDGEAETLGPRSQSKKPKPGPSSN